MDSGLEILKTTFAKTFGAALGAAAVFGVLLVIVAVLAVPVYLVLRRRVSAHVDLRWGETKSDGLHFHDAVPSAGQGDGSAGDRSEFIQRLDAVDRVATSVYEMLMYVVIAGITGLAMFFYLVAPDDGNRDFLLLYGGVLYLIGMLWATSQLYRMRRRRAGEPAKGIRSALSQLGAKIDVQVKTGESQVFKLDDAALESVQHHLDGGGSVDEACALVVPQYAAMNRVMKAVLRKAVEAALAARRTA
jgi:hypothetical protein